MKLQFSIRTLLVAMAAIAIWMGGAVAVLQLYGFEGLPRIGLFLVSTGIGLPLWLPLIFLGYGIGRQCITARWLITLAIAEVASIGVAAVFLYLQGRLMVWLYNGP